MEIEGGTVVYELVGSGPLLVWNAGGREQGVGQHEPLATLLGDRYSILVWDRRNSAGASDICLSSAKGATQADADDLHALLQALGVGKACIGGGSMGSVLSLYMAARYPEDVLSILAIKPPSMDEEMLSMMAEATWYGLARQAEEAGMQAVDQLSSEAWRKVNDGTADAGERALSWVSRSIEANPRNRDSLLAIDPKRFAAMMRRWGDDSRRAIPAGLNPDEIRAVEAPALVVPGDDPIHPEESGLWLAEQLVDADLSVADPSVEITTGEQWWASMLPAVERLLAHTLHGQ